MDMTACGCLSHGDSLRHTSVSSDIWTEERNRAEENDPPRRSSVGSLAWWRPEDPTGSAGTGVVFVRRTRGAAASWLLEAASGSIRALCGPRRKESRQVDFDYRAARCHARPRRARASRQLSVVQHFAAARRPQGGAE